MSESQLLNLIMRELGKHGAIFRCNAGQFYTKSGQKVSGLPRGFTDLLYIGSNGLPVFIECKIGRNRPTPEQERFISKMQGLNCRAGVCRSVSEAMELCGIGGD